MNPKVKLLFTNKKGNQSDYDLLKEIIIEIDNEKIKFTKDKDGKFQKFTSENNEEWKLQLNQSNKNPILFNAKEAILSSANYIKFEKDSELLTYKDSYENLVSIKNSYTEQNLYDLMAGKKELFFGLGHCFLEKAEEHLENALRSSPLHTDIGKNSLKPNLNYFSFSDVGKTVIDLVSSTFKISERYSEVKTKKIAIVMIGDNDIASFADKDDYKGEASKEIVSEMNPKLFLKPYENAIKKLKSTGFEIVMVIPPAPLNNESKVYEYGLPNDHIKTDPQDFKEMQKYLLDIAEKYNIFTIQFKDNEFKRADDDWHLKDKEYNKLFREIIKKSCEHFKIDNHPLLDFVNKKEFVYNSETRREILEIFNNSSTLPELSEDKEKNNNYAFSYKKFKESFLTLT